MAKRATATATAFLVALALFAAGCTTGASSSQTTASGPPRTTFFADFLDTTTTTPTAAEPQPVQPGSPTPADPTTPNQTPTQTPNISPPDVNAGDTPLDLFIDAPLYNALPEPPAPTPSLNIEAALADPDLAGTLFWQPPITPTAYAIEEFGELDAIAQALFQVNQLIPIAEYYLNEDIALRCDSFIAEAPADQPLNAAILDANQQLLSDFTQCMLANFEREYRTNDAFSVYSVCGDDSRYPDLTPETTMFDPALFDPAPGPRGATPPDWDVADAFTHTAQSMLDRAGWTHAINVGHAVHPLLCSTLLEDNLGGLVRILAWILAEVHLSGLVRGISSTFYKLFGTPPPVNWEFHLAGISPDRRLALLAICYTGSDHLEYLADGQGTSFIYYNQVVVWDNTHYKAGDYWGTVPDELISDVLGEISFDRRFDDCEDGYDQTRDIPADIMANYPGLASMNTFPFQTHTITDAELEDFRGYPRAEG